MVLHDQSYPLGHIVTARFWQDVRTNDIHFTLSDTVGRKVHGVNSIGNGSKVQRFLSMISEANSILLKSCP